MSKIAVRTIGAVGHLTAWLAAVSLLMAGSAFAAQSWRGKRVFFGDVHRHSCLSQDAHVTPTSQYESLFHDYGLDFSMTSEHAEGTEAGRPSRNRRRPEVM